MPRSIQLTAAIGAALSICIALLHAEPETQKEADPVVIVGKGETIDTFARRYLKNPRDWKKVLEANKLTRASFAPGKRIKIDAALANAGEARVLAFEETAQYSPSVSETWRPVHVGLRVFKLDRIRTDATGSIRLMLRNNMLIGVRPLTRLIVQVSSRPDAGGIFLQKGRIRSVSQSKELLNYRIITPAAKIRVTGTDFLTEVKPDGGTMVECYTGSVNVRARGVEVEVKAGFRVSVPNGQAPGTPVRHALPPPAMN